MPISIPAGRTGLSGQNRESNDTGLFNLKIDGTTFATDVGNNGTTGVQFVTIGSHTVSETAGTGTSLTDYISVIGGDCDASGNVTLAAGDSKTCTITNTRRPRLHPISFPPWPIPSASSS